LTAVNLPSTPSTFPGTLTATVTVTPDPNAQVPATTNVPLGTVTLTLTCWTAGCTQAPVQQTAQAQGDDTGTSAQFQLSNIPGGAYCVTAAYGGSVVNLFKPSQSPACAVGSPNFTVNPLTPVITLSEPLGVSPNSANGVYYVQNGQTTITLTANVSAPSGVTGAPSGNIVFTNGATLANGGTQIQSVAADANGNAIFNTNTLAIGSYNIYANYSGDQNFAALSSSVIAFQVIPQSVLITSNPTSITTPQGTPVASTLTLYSLAGYAASSGATITCDNTTLPYYSECTFSVPQPVICAPPGSTSNPCSGMVSTTVTISTDIPVNLPPGSSAKVRALGAGTSPLIPAGIFGVGLFGLAMRRRAIFKHKLLSCAWIALLLVGTVMGFGGCTNSSYTHTPPRQVYTTATGTSNVSIVVLDPTTKAVVSLPFTLPLTVTAH